MLYSICQSNETVCHHATANSTSAVGAGSEQPVRLLYFLADRLLWLLRIHSIAPVQPTPQLMGICLYWTRGNLQSNISRSSGSILLDSCEHHDHSFSHSRSPEVRPRNAIVSMISAEQISYKVDGPNNRPQSWFHRIIEKPFKETMLPYIFPAIVWTRNKAAQAVNHRCDLIKRSLEFTIILFLCHNF